MLVCVCVCVCICGARMHPTEWVAGEQGRVSATCEIPAVFVCGTSTHHLRVGHTQADREKGSVCVSFSVFPCLCVGSVHVWWWWWCSSCVSRSWSSTRSVKWEWTVWWPPSAPANTFALCVGSSPVVAVYEVPLSLSLPFFLLLPFLLVCVFLAMSCACVSALAVPSSPSSTCIPSP